MLNSFFHDTRGPPEGVVNINLPAVIGYSLGLGTMVLFSPSHVFARSHTAGN